MMTDRHYCGESARNEGVELSDTATTLLYVCYVPSIEGPAAENACLLIKIAAWLAHKSLRLILNST